MADTIPGPSGAQPVAPSADDAPPTINILKPPIVRLPIGRSATYPLQGLQKEESAFVLWVPTNGGGKLTLSTHSLVQVALERPLGKVLKTGTKSLTFDVPDQQHGEYFFIVAAPAATAICEFVQVGLAREDASQSAAPLVPWNFWYFPAAANVVDPMTGRRYSDPFAAKTMKKYAKAFKLVDATGPATWEYDSANRHVDLYADEWEGHCHNAAPSSAIFHLPAPGGTFTVNGVQFTRSELMLLAAEFFGNFGQDKRVWALPDGPPLGKYSLWRLLKPGEPADAKVLMDRILAVTPKPLTAPDHTHDQKVQAATEAGLFIANQNGASAYEKTVRETFGRLAAEFYEKLILKLSKEKTPLVADARVYDGARGANEVWNQVFFYYRARYQEDASQDNRLMNIQCDLYANVDDNSANLAPYPATVKGSEVTPVPPFERKAQVLLYNNIWLLAFTVAGGLEMNDKRNRWTSHQNINGQELYAPTDVFELTSLVEQRHGQASGNPYITWDLVKAGALVLHKRFGGP